MRYINLFLIFLLLISVIPIEALSTKQHQNDGSYFMNLSDRDLALISNKTVLFGHQSVGANIIDGLRSLQSGRQIIGIYAIPNNGELKNGAINHVYIGQNFNPLGKVEEFARLMDQYGGHPPDIAFFKFCYLDIDQHTDIDKLFTVYKKTIIEIEKRYPDTSILHATVPLRQLQKGPKAWIKRVIGKPVTGLFDNVAREKFNQLIRAEFGNRKSLFDIAEFESTYPDGGRESFVQDGKMYYALVPQYTEDGDHLNLQGGEVLASRLIQALAEAAGKYGK